MRGRANKFVSFAEAHPDLVPEWHPRKNRVSPTEVPHGSSLVAWWSCSVRGHPDYEQRVSKRHAGQGCPKCGVLRRAAKRRTPPPGGSLADVHPDLAAQWSTLNDVRPEELKPQSHVKVWWACPIGEHPDYQKSPNTRVSEASGCPLCGNLRKGQAKRIPLPGKSVADLHPHLTCEWDAKNLYLPTQLKPGSDELVAWICQKCGHRWKATVKARANGAGCFPCAVKKRAAQSRRPKPGQSLQDLFPQVAKQWHPERNGVMAPGDFKPRSQFTAYWKCPMGADHEWAAIIADRTGSENRPGTGCPYCPTAQRPKASSTNNLTLRPDLLAELHPTRNKDFDPQTVTVSSRKQLWWKCRVCGDEKKMSVNSRAQTSGCPMCNPARRSMREIRLECELTRVLEPRRYRFDSRHVRIGNRRYECDIILESISVIVEYDGSYWHKGRAREDRRKSLDLQNAGWTVIRVREAPLKPILNRDVQIAPWTSIKVVADAVLEVLVRLNLASGDRVLDYLSSPREIASARAEREISRLRRPSRRRTT